MSEPRSACERFASWLLEDRPTRLQGAWRDHLESCAGCREQWVAHQMLAASFADEAMPALSPAFAPGLRRKIRTANAYRPLRGWRLAAMTGYAVVAALLLAWVLTKFPVPSPPIDLSSPWALAAAIAAVPVTLWLASEASRWLPSIHRKKPSTPGGEA